MELNEFIQVNYDEITPKRIIQILAEHNERFNNALMHLQDVINTVKKISINESDTKSIGIKAATILTACIVSKKRQGLGIKDYSAEDWDEIKSRVKEFSLELDPSKYSEFVFTLYANAFEATISILPENTSESIRKELLDDNDKLKSLIEDFRQANTNEIQFIENSEMLCLEIIVKILSAYSSLFANSDSQEAISNYAIYIFELGRYSLYKKEADLLNKCKAARSETSEALKDDFRQFLSEWIEKSNTINNLILNAFDSNVDKAFSGSAELAKALGLNQTEVLDSIEDIDDFFLN